MAKYRVLCIFLFGLFCIINVISGQDYAPDPSLDEIKQMDAQEGLPRDFIPQKKKEAGSSGQGTYGKSDVDDIKTLPNRLKDDQHSRHDILDKDLQKRHTEDNMVKKATTEYENKDVNTEENENLQNEVEVVVSEPANYNSEFDEETANSEISVQEATDTESHAKNAEKTEEPASVESTKEVSAENEPDEWTVHENIVKEKEIISIQPVLEFVGDEESKINEIMNPTEEEFKIIFDKNETENWKEGPETDEEPNSDTGYERENEEYESAMENETETREEEPETEEELNTDTVYEMENEEYETAIEDEREQQDSEDTQREKGKNELENDTQRQFLNTDFEENFLDEEVSDAEELDSTENIPTFLTDFQLQQKDPEVDTNPLPSEKMDPACRLPPQTGFCKAYFRRYYFNSKIGECQTFVYGGCGGNANNFHTLEECMQTCSQNSVHV